MDIYINAQNYPFPQEKVKEAYLNQLSEKDTNQDSDEERNINWQVQGPLDPSLKQIGQLQNKKLKNELCRNFIRNGVCNYGFKCQFAHGIDELRKNQNQNSKYKTKRCHAYFNEGVCMYGMRCNFLHQKGQKQIKKKQPKTTLSVLLKNHPELVIVERSRLKFFQSFDQNTEYYQMFECKLDQNDIVSLHYEIQFLDGCMGVSSECQSNEKLLFLYDINVTYFDKKDLRVPRDQIEFYEIIGLIRHHKIEIQIQVENGGN